MQGKRSAIGKSPQVAAVDSTLVFVARDRFQKRALPIQTAITALNALTLDGDRNVFEAEKDIVEIVLHGPPAQGFKMDAELGQIAPVTRNKPAVPKQQSHHRRHDWKEQTAAPRKNLCKERDNIAFT